MKISQEKLNEIIESHGKWLKDEYGGVKADLSSADLSSANLRYADLSFSKTDKKYLQISCIGSRKDGLTYCFDNDLILCGCWNNYKGGTLKEFEKRINNIYGKQETDEEKQYFNEYIGAINYIKFLRGE